MASGSDNSPQEPPGGPAPWWVAAAGGGDGITAAVLQDHVLAWAILAAFTVWLAHDLIIAWIASRHLRRPSGRHTANLDAHPGRPDPTK